MKSDKTKLETLFDSLTDKLTERVRSGDVTAADLNVARAFLKDNGIEVSNPANLQPLVDGVTNALPFVAPDDTPVPKRKNA